VEPSPLADDLVRPVLRASEPGRLVMRDVFDYVDLKTPLPSYALSRPAEAILWRRVGR
jgi:hypothetical protein